MDLWKEKEKKEERVCVGFLLYPEELSKEWEGMGELFEQPVEERVGDANALWHGDL